MHCGDENRKGVGKFPPVKIHHVMEHGFGLAVVVAESNFIKDTLPLMNMTTYNEHRIVSYCEIEFSDLLLRHNMDDLI